MICMDICMFLTCAQVRLHLDMVLNVAVKFHTHEQQCYEVHYYEVGGWGGWEKRLILHFF